MTAFLIFVSAFNLGVTRESQTCPDNTSYRVAHFQSACLQLPIPTASIRVPLFSSVKPSPLSPSVRVSAKTQEMVAILLLQQTLNKQPLSCLFCLIFTYFHMPQNFSHHVVQQRSYGALSHTSLCSNISTNTCCMSFGRLLILLCVSSASLKWG